MILKYIIAILLLLPVHALAADGVLDWYAAASTAPFCDSRTGALVCQDFNTTGTPSGWTTSGGDFNFDATTTAMEGAQYLTLAWTSANGYVLTPTFTAATTVYVAAPGRVRTYPSSTNSSFILFYNNTTGLGYARMDTTGGVQAFAADGGATPYSACFSLNTIKFFKARYVAGSGSNASITIWSSDTGASGTWTQLQSSTNGQATLGADRIRLAQNNGIIWDVDTIVVDDEDINF